MLFSRHHTSCSNASQTSSDPFIFTGLRGRLAQVPSASYWAYEQYQHQQMQGLNHSGSSIDAGLLQSQLSRHWIRGQLTSCLGAPRDPAVTMVADISDKSLYGVQHTHATTLCPAASSNVWEVDTSGMQCSTTSSPPSYNVISSLSHTIMSVKLPIATIVHYTLVPPVYQLQIPAHSQLQCQLTPVPDPY